MSETLIKTEFAPIGGGGNPLRAWVLACFDVVKFFIDWVLGCFYILIPPYEGEYNGVPTDLKKSNYPSPDFAEKQVFRKINLSHNGRGLQNFFSVSNIKFLTKVI